MHPKRSRKSSVDWMHPSWRDLVIEHLASDESQRREFLLHTGLHGFLLALSSAGGATGGRQTPLLVREDDWEALTQAVDPVLNTGWSAAWSVLNALQEALKSSASSGQPHNLERSPLARLSDAVLTRLREHWSQCAYSPGPFLLDRYYVVSQFISPLPPGPNLQPIWETSSTALLTQIKEFNSEKIEVGFDEIADWVRLAATVSENEPRFLRQVGYPECFVEIIREFLPYLSERGGREFDFESENECSDEETRLEELADLASSIGELLDDFTNDADEIRRVARWNKQRVVAIRDALEKDERARSQEDNIKWQSSLTMADEVAGGATAGQADMPLNVSEIFADL